jgi:hypothetical protein
VTQPKRATSAVLRKRIADTLAIARGATDSEAALAAGETLRRLIETLQDRRVERRAPGEEVNPTLGELQGALGQVDKLRLSNREFVDASADELLGELTDKDALNIFERKYRGRYVRWKVKFNGKDEAGGFIVNAGSHVEISCVLDPCEPPERLEQFERWQVITLEGRLHHPSAFGNAMDPQRARLVVDLCMVR